MNRKQFFNCFDLDDDAVFNQKVDSVSAVDGDALIEDGQADLALKTQSIGGELVLQAGTVRTLKKAGTKVSVNLDGRLDYALGYVIVNHRMMSSVSSVSPVVASENAKQIKDRP
jgi:hypothetical protein